MNATQQSVLVISQIYYPGWKAYVDGKPVSLFPADYALVGIHVLPGDHDVRLSFEPFTFRIGLLLSCLTLTVIMATVVRRKDAYSEPR